MAKIYISSTSKDLQREREAAAKAVRRLNHQAICMEDYAASDQRPVDKCLQDVRNCDAYLGIFAWRYGYIPDGYDKSITHLEYEAARKANIPCLIFLLDENAPWPVKNVGKGEEWEKIDRLRSELLKGHIVSFFKNAEELSGLVSAAISVKLIKFPPHETGPVTMPGMFRYILDRWLPRVHTWLTIRIGLFKQPSEWSALNNYLRTLHSTIAGDIREKTFVVPLSKDLPDEIDRIKVKQSGFLTPIQQLIREIMGISEGGDAQNARISAISKKSKFVRNIMKRLLRADEPLILLGDPGTGKSITLQQAAMLVAEKESKRVFPTICLFIRLGEFQLPGEIDNHSVWNYVKRKTPQEIQPFIDNLKDKGRLIIFFDGMDEMSRERYSEHTHALSVFAGSMKRITRTLFSCRVTDFTPLFKHNRLVLMPFRRSHIYQYIKRHIPHFPIKIGNEYLSARQLAKRLTRGGLPMQADNPFVLWLFCNYLQEEEEWPKSRVHLLEHYLRSNYQRKALEAEPSKVLMPNMNRTFLTLGRIAYEITNRNKGTAIPVDEVKTFLASEELDTMQAGIKCGVLQKSLDLETTLIRFEHQRFQEYFAALYLKNNEQEQSMFKWLDKLDAPRWQETLFNLVLMGGGHEALTTLNQSIQQGITQLSELRTAGNTLEAPLETLVADRVELASRILQQVQQQSDDTFKGLYETFRHAAYWLADHGNPITKVKMMWAANIVPGIDIYRVARESLASPVSWVRQQALVITTAASGKTGGEALKEDVLHGFASSRFLNRFSDYVRIASVLKQKKLWRVLIIGFVLSILQILAGFGIVSATRNRMVPSLLGVETVINKLAELGFYIEEAKALIDKDEKEVRGIKKERKDWYIIHDQTRKCLTAVQEVYDSKWFLFVLIGAILISILLAMRKISGQHLFVGQNVGFICLLLPVIWKFIGNIGNEMLAYLGIIFSLFFVLFFYIVNWILIIFIQGSTLLLFVVSSYHWTGPVRNKQMLLDALWENSDSKSGTKIAIILNEKIVYNERFLNVSAIAGFFSIVPIYVLLIAPFKVFWKRFLEAIGLFSFLPLGANVSISLILYLEIIVILVVLVLRLRGKYNWWVRHMIFLIFSITFLILIIILIIITLLSWVHGMINWEALWTYILETFAILPFFPESVNVALSAAIYIEVIGCLVSLVSGLKQKYHRWRKGTEMLIFWTLFSLMIVALTFLFWGLEYILSNYLSNALGIIFLLAMVVTLVIVLRLIWREIIPLLDLIFQFLGIRRSIGPGYSIETWKKELEELNPNSQASLLRRTEPQNLELKMDPFLSLLQEIEPIIKEEPALSVYWAKRNQVEQILRQEKSG